MILDSLNAVIMIFILMAIGFIVTKTKWYIPEAQGFISKLVFVVALPCTIFVNVTQNFEQDMLADYLLPFVAATFATVALYLIAKGCVHVFKVPDGHRGIYTTLVSVSNCGFIGFPVAMVIFGDEGMVPAVMYFIAQNLLINLVGLSEVSADGINKGKTDIKTTLKMVFNPLLLTSLGSLVLVAVGFKYEMLPDFIGTTAEMLNNITSPLSLIFVGMVIGSMGFKNLRIDRPMISVFVLRFVGAPMLMLLFGYLLQVDPFIVQVSMIIAALPSMVQVSILAKTFNADVNYAVTGIFYTTLLSFITIPVYMVITTSLLF